MSTVVDDLFANLTRCCADAARCRQAVTDLQDKLEQATYQHLAAQSDLTKAEDEIKKHAIQNASML